MTTDPYRPRFHFLPPAGWLNDPNGLVQWQGLYHMYYQYYPYSAEPGPKHWGHAVSHDLVRWEHRPIALAPLPGSPDADGVWSGCAVPLAGRVAFLYTGVVNQPDGDLRQTACLAYGEGDLNVLERFPGNPVIAAPPADGRHNGFRDHSVWMQPDGWRMVTGSGLGTVGQTLLYASVDLENWQYVGVFCDSTQVPESGFGIGSMWECPSFFQDNNQAGLIYSGMDHGGYGSTILTGNYADPRFHPSKAAKLDWGERVFYAPQVFRDESGRLIMFGWIMEEKPWSEMASAEWWGIMSLPREIRIDAQGNLHQTFLPSLATLRGRGQELRNLTPPVQPLELEPRGSALELNLQMPIASSGDLSFGFFCSAAGTPQVRLVLDWAAGRLLLQRGDNLPEFSAPLPSGETLRLRAFLDASVCEILLNDRISLTGRCYPARPADDRVFLSASPSAQPLTLCTLHEIQSAW